MLCVFIVRSSGSCFLKVSQTLLQQTSEEPLTPKSNIFCLNLWALLQRASMSPNYRQCRATEIERRERFSRETMHQGIFHTVKKIPIWCGGKFLPLSFNVNSRLCTICICYIVCLWFFNQTHVIKTNLAGTEANLFQTTIYFPAAAAAAVQR